MKQMKKGMFLFLTLFLIFILAACGGGSDNSGESNESNESDNNSEATENEASESGSDDIQEVTIKVSHVVAESTPKHQGSIAFKEYIEEKSGGKIEVEIYPNGQLFDDETEVDNLTANNVQLIIRDMSKLVGMNEAYNIPALPFLFSSNEEAYTFWDGEKGQEILTSLEDKGIIGLKMWPNGPKHLTNNKRPVTKPEDMEGLKIRVQGGQVLAAIFDELGAGALQLPFGELYTALEQGTVDGQVNTYNNTATKKFGEVQKYITTNWGAARVDYALLTNKTFMDGLNEPTKELFLEAIDHATGEARGLAEELNAQSLQDIKDNGLMEIHELSTEERAVFQEKLQPIYDEFGDQVGQDYIEAAQEIANQS